MAKQVGNVALREARILFGVGATRNLTDGELLERFSLNRDEVGGLAFEALVNRHGSMVMRTCQGILHDPNDAEDAFQATFLVLARKAGSLWVANSIVPWLHGVACRIATRSLSDRARRQRHEQRVALLTPSCSSHNGLDDLNPILHAEIGRLPECYRSPIVLCYLEGLTHDQAAHQLAWPVGTVRSRLSRGRERLRKALQRRGIAPTSLIPGLSASANFTRTVHPTQVEAAVRAATWVALGEAAAGVGTTVATLSQRVLMTMALSQFSRLASVVLLTGVVASGAAAIALRDSASSSMPAAHQGNDEASSLTRRQWPQRSEAERLADRILDLGSKLFNAKNSPGLAATYTEDGTIHLMSVEPGQHREERKRGRGEVEQFYQDTFRQAGSVHSENVVDFAHLVSPELLIIHGQFFPNRGVKPLPFVQLRVKQENQWLTKTLWLFLTSGFKEPGPGPTDRSLAPGQGDPVHGGQTPSPFLREADGRLTRRKLKAPLSLGGPPMFRFALLALALVVPSTAWTQEADAKKLAQEILDKGSALYDTKDAAAMTATYTEDARIYWYSKKDSGEIEQGTKTGRAEIEGVYRDLFKDPNEKTTSKNTVEYARFLSPDLMIVQGIFQPNLANPGKFPFVQVRIKQGDKWLMKTLEFFAISQD